MAYFNVLKKSKFPSRHLLLCWLVFFFVSLFLLIDIHVSSIFLFQYLGSNYSLCWLLWSVHIRTISWRYSWGMSVLLIYLLLILGRTVEVRKRYSNCLHLRILWTTCSILHSGNCIFVLLSDLSARNGCCLPVITVLTADPEPLSFKRATPLWWCFRYLSFTLDLFDEYIPSKSSFQTIMLTYV